MNRAVFLDRDGVLLDHKGSVFPGTKAILDRLRNEGLLLIVVTNQPDIALGKMKAVTAKRVNESLRQILSLTDIFMCPHDELKFCSCRKPKPGMLREASEKHDIDLSSSFMVGDRWRDVSAGNEAGCKTILMKAIFHICAAIINFILPLNFRDAILRFHGRTVEDRVFVGSQAVIEEYREGNERNRQARADEIRFEPVIAMSAVERELQKAHKKRKADQAQPVHAPLPDG